MDVHKLIIVDDDPDLLFVLQTRMESYGFQTYTFTSVEEALENISSINPELVLLDLGFAEADGTAFLWHLKDYIEPGARLPQVIVISALNNQEIIDFAMELGAAAYVVKPYDEMSLRTTISDHLPSENMILFDSDDVHAVS